MNPSEQPLVIPVAFYSPSAGDCIRIAVLYEDAWRPIFWLQVAKDGSVYLGPRFREISILKKGSKPVEEGRASVRYEEGQPVTDPAVLKASKVSFHASGIIHAAGDRLLRDSLRTIEQQQELCRVLFQHPRKYAPISKIEDRDICLNYRFDEQKPLQGLLFVAPANNVTIVRVPSATNQINLVLPFCGLAGCPDIVLQFVLGHGPEGGWPPYTYLLFGVQGVRQDESA